MGVCRNSNNNLYLVMCLHALCAFCLALRDFCNSFIILFFAVGGSVLVVIESLAALNYYRVSCVQQATGPLEKEKQTKMLAS